MKRKITDETMKTIHKYYLKKIRYIFTGLGPLGKPIFLILLTVLFAFTLYLGITFSQNYSLILYGLILAVITIIVSETMMVSSPEIKYSGKNMLDDSRKISIEKFIPSALNSFKIFTGEFNSRFYTKEVLNQFKRIIDERNVNVQAVYGPNFDVECFGILELALNGKIKLYELPKRSQVNYPHFRVIDGMHVCGDFSTHKIFRDYSGGRFWFNKIITS